MKKLKFEIGEPPTVNGDKITIQLIQPAGTAKELPYTSILELKKGKRVNIIYDETKKEPGIIKSIEIL